MEDDRKDTGQIEYEPDISDISDKAIGTAQKVQSGCVAAWAYGFYGAILALGIFLLTQGEMFGLALIGGAVVLFLLYWLFGFTLFIK